MRIVVASFLVFVMLMQVFSKTIIYSTFLVEQEYIAKNLCENRNVPEKKCCGKCQLEKRMKNDEQNRDSQLPSLFKSLNEITLTHEALPAFKLKSFFTSGFLFPCTIESSYTVMNRAIFRPPCFA
jgi:hypothetical protein